MPSSLQEMKEPPSTVSTTKRDGKGGSKSVSKKKSRTRKTKKGSGLPSAMHDEPTSGSWKALAAMARGTDIVKRQTAGSKKTMKRVRPRTATMRIHGSDTTTTTTINTSCVSSVSLPPHSSQTTSNSTPKNKKKLPTTPLKKRPQTAKVRSMHVASAPILPSASGSQTQRDIHHRPYKRTQQGSHVSRITSRPRTGPSESRSKGVKDKGRKEEERGGEEEEEEKQEDERGRGVRRTHAWTSYEVNKEEKEEEAAESDPTSKTMAGGTIASRVDHILAMMDAHQREEKRKRFAAGRSQMAANRPSTAAPLRSRPHQYGKGGTTQRGAWRKQETRPQTSRKRSSTRDSFDSAATAELLRRCSMTSNDDFLSHIPIPVDIHKDLNERETNGGKTNKSEGKDGRNKGERADQDMETLLREWETESDCQSNMLTKKEEEKEEEEDIVTRLREWETASDCQSNVLDSLLLEDAEESVFSSSSPLPLSPTVSQSPSPSPSPSHSRSTSLSPSPYVAHHGSRPSLDLPAGHSVHEAGGITTPRGPRRSALLSKRRSDCSDATDEEEDQMKTPIINQSLSLQVSTNRTRLDTSRNTIVSPTRPTPRRTVSLSPNLSPSHSPSPSPSSPKTPQFSLDLAAIQNREGVGATSRTSRPPQHKRYLNEFSASKNLQHRATAASGSTNRKRCLSSFMQSDLALAVKKGDLDLVLRLLEELGEDCNVNETDRNGSTALYHAAWHGYTEIANVLLDSGADVNIRNLRQNTCTDLAMERSNVGTVRSFIRFGADVTMDDYRRVAKNMGAKAAQIDPEILSLLQVTEAQPDLHRALFLAVRRRDTAAAMKLLEQIVEEEGDAAGILNEKDAVGWGVLHYAAYNGMVELTGHLCRRYSAVAPIGFDQVNDEEMTPLQIALSRSHYSLAELLVRHMPEGEGEVRLKGILLQQQASELASSICACIRTGNFELLEELLCGDELASLAVNVGNKHDTTALHLAVMYGDCDMCELLLVSGADPNAKNRRGMTALQLAIEHSHDDLVPILIQNGASISVKEAIATLVMVCSGEDHLVSFIVKPNGNGIGTGRFCTSSSPTSAALKAVELSFYVDPSITDVMDVVEILLAHSSPSCLPEALCMAVLEKALSEGVANAQNYTVMELVREYQTRVEALYPRRGRWRTDSKQKAEDSVINDKSNTGKNGGGHQNGNKLEASQENIEHSNDSPNDDTDRVSMGQSSPDQVKRTTKGDAVDAVLEEQPRVNRLLSWLTGPSSNKGGKGDNESNDTEQQDVIEEEREEDGFDSEGDDEEQQIGGSGGGVDVPPLRIDTGLFDLPVQPSFLPVDLQMKLLWVLEAAGTKKRKGKKSRYVYLVHCYRFLIVYIFLVFIQRLCRCFCSFFT